MVIGYWAQYGRNLSLSFLVGEMPKSPALPPSQGSCGNQAKLERVRGAVNRRPASQVTWYSNTFPIWGEGGKALSPQQEGRGLGYYVRGQALHAQLAPVPWPNTGIVEWGCPEVRGRSERILVAMASRQRWLRDWPQYVLPQLLASWVFPALSLLVPVGAVSYQTVFFCCLVIYNQLQSFLCVTSPDLWSLQLCPCEAFSMCDVAQWFFPWRGWKWLDAWALETLEAASRGRVLG